MNTKGIIFDLDGTLADSIIDIAESMNLVLKEQNLPTHHIDAYKQFAGNGLQKLVERALPEILKTGEPLINNTNKMLEVYGKNCVNKTKLYPGIEDLLNQLHKKRIKIAVLSNKLDDLTQKVVKVLLANWKLSFVSGISSNVERKPDPKGALLAAKKMGLLPNEIIFVGDSDVDMKTAKNAGMTGIGVLWGFRGDKELRANGAKATINKPVDLINYL